MFPEICPPIVIVQHMPEGFTRSFARRLDGSCAIHVREAADGEEIQPSTVYIAPGGLRHMTVVRAGHRWMVRLTEGDPVCFSRPSIDVLFHSIANEAGRAASAAILTGMGRDGAAGLRAIRRAGGRTFAQDEATSVVYGMPKVAQEIGAVERQLPLERIGAEIVNRCNLAREAV